MPTDGFKLSKAYSHAFGKTHYRGNPPQEVYESQYKSLGNITPRDVWLDFVPYFDNALDAVQDSLTNSAVNYYDKVTLTPVPGSNNQAYRLEIAGTPIRPWISPVDVPDPSTNFPADGYELRLFTQNDNPISTTEGQWVVDYYAGLIMFQDGYTPPQMIANGLDIWNTWGDIKVSVFAYAGKTLEDTSVSGGTGPAGVSALNDLSDVDTSTKSDGDVLRYNQSAGAWEPGPASGATGGSTGLEIITETVSASSTKVVDANNLLNFRTVKYVLSLDTGSKYSSQEILVLNKIVESEYSQYAVLGDVSFYDVSIRPSDGDMVLEIENKGLVPLTVKFSKTLY